MGLLGGLGGSLLDSWLGATIQASFFDARRGVVVQGRGVWGDGAAPRGGDGKPLRRLCGKDWLTNHEVNFVSAVATSALCGSAGAWIFKALAPLLMPEQPEFI